VGMTDNVREYLWAADALLFPTAYEVFSLASLEAAAAATPLLVTKVNGIEEFVRPGENGIFIERTVEGIKRGIIRFLALSPADRKSIGLQAQRDVAPYSVTRFAESWRLFYDGRIHSSNPPEILSAGVPGSIPQR